MVVENQRRIVRIFGVVTKRTFNKYKRVPVFNFREPMEHHLTESKSEKLYIYCIRIIR